MITIEPNSKFDINRDTTQVRVISENKVNGQRFRQESAIFTNVPLTKQEMIDRLPYPKNYKDGDRIEVTSNFIVPKFV